MTKKRAKQVISFSNCRDLMTVDQMPIRNQAIRELEKWHDKIEMIEVDLQKFQDSDVKLYNDWLQMVIGKVQAEVILAQEKFEKLGTLHNWVVLTSEELNISFAHAYFLMLEEEVLNEKGTEIEKAEIEKNRQIRNDKIKEKIKAEYFDQFDESEADFDLENQYENKQQDENSDKDEALEKQQFYKEREKLFKTNAKIFKKVLTQFEKLADKDIQMNMKTVKSGFEFITEVLLICIQCNRFDLVNRYWKLTPEKIKKQFNMKFLIEMGTTLEEFIEEKNNEERDYNQKKFDNEGFAFNESTCTDSVFDKNEIKQKETESAKVIYRKIMLKIHPDKLSSPFVEVNKKWLDRLWIKIQSAYDALDVISLQTLRIQISVKLKQYDELDYSELVLAAKQLESDYLKTCQTHKDMVNHPAWGFSNIKSFQKIEKMVTEPYRQNLKELKKETKRIEQSHAAWRDMIRVINANGGFGPIKPPKKRKSRRTEFDGWRY